MKRYLSEPISQNVSREEVAHFVMQVIGTVNVRVCTTQVPSGKLIRIFVIETANIIQAGLKLCTRAFKISSGFIRFFPAESMGLTFNLQPLLKLALKFESQDDDQYLKDLLGHLQQIGRCQVQAIKSLKDECALLLQVQPNYTLASLLGDSDNHVLAFRGVSLDVHYHDEPVSLESSKQGVDIEELLGKSLPDQRSVNLPSSNLTDTYVSSSELSVLSQAIMTRLAIEETTTASVGSQNAVNSPSPVPHHVLHPSSVPHNNNDDELSDLEEEYLTPDKPVCAVDPKSQTILKTFQKKLGMKGSAVTPNPPKLETNSKKAHRSVVEIKPSQEAFRKLIRADSPSKQETGVPDHLRWVHLAALKRRTEQNTNKLSGSSLLQEIFSHHHEVQRYSAVVRECLEERCRKLILIKDKLRLEKHMKKKIRKEKKKLRSIQDNLQAANPSNVFGQNPSWVEDEESDDPDSDDESEQGDSIWIESAKQPQPAQGNYRYDEVGVSGVMYPQNQMPVANISQQPYSSMSVNRTYGGRPCFGYNQGSDFVYQRPPEDAVADREEFRYNHSGGYRHTPATPSPHGINVPMYGESLYQQPPRTYQAPSFHHGGVCGNRQALSGAGASFGHYEPRPPPANHGLGYRMAGPWEVPGTGHHLNNPAAWQRVEQPPIPLPTQYMPCPSTLYPPRTPWSNPGFYPN